MGGCALRSLHSFTSLQLLRIHSLRSRLTTDQLNALLRQLPALTECDIRAEVTCSGHLPFLSPGNADISILTYSSKNMENSMHDNDDIDA